MADVRLPVPGGNRDQEIAPTTGSTPVSQALQHEVEQFLYAEARLLDERRYREWYGLLADDLEYVMPLRYNRLARERDHELSSENESAWFDETRSSIDMRIKRLETGLAWAEEPPSRCRHLITNIAVQARGEVLEVRSYFHVYRSRLERQVDQFTGERTDLLRRVPTALGFELVRRRIVLDQSTLLSNNLSIFF